MDNVLTVDELLAAKDYKEEVLKIPEWGGSVKIRTLSLAARYAINEAAFVESGKRKVDAVKFVAHTLKHGIVEPRLSEEQALKLVDKNGAVVEKVSGAIWRISGLSDEEAKKGLPRG